MQQKKNLLTHSRTTCTHVHNKCIIDKNSSRSIESNENSLFLANLLDLTRCQLERCMNKLFIQLEVKSIKTKSMWWFDSY